MGLAGASAICSMAKKARSLTGAVRHRTSHPAALSGGVGKKKARSPLFALQGIGDRQRRGDRTSAAACAAGGRAVPGRAQSIGDRFIPAAARRRPKIYRPIRRQAQSLYAFRRDGVASAGKGRPPLSRRFFAGGCGTSSPCRQDDKRSNAAGGIGNFGISKDGVLTNAIAFFFSTG